MRHLVIYPELEPSRRREVILARLERIVEAYRRIDIPDIPLGKPSISSPVLSVLARHAYSADVIAHLRTQDHNILSIKSIIKTLSYAGVKRLIALRGDPPQQGKPCEHTWNPEDAVKYARDYGVEAGLLISPRKPGELIEERALVGADYYYITRVHRDYFEKINQIVSVILRRSPNSRLAGYLVLSTSRNKRYLQEYHIPSLTLEELPRVIEFIEQAGFSRAILSAPGDGDYLYSKELTQTLRELGFLQ
jgi:plasmid stabilization system protein ParE